MHLRMRTDALDCEPVALLHLAATMAEATSSSSSSLPAHPSLLHDLSSQRTSVPVPHVRRCSTASVVAVLIEFAAGKDSCAFMEGQGLALSSIQSDPCSSSSKIQALAQLVSHTSSRPGGPGIESQAPQFLLCCTHTSTSGQVCCWASTVSSIRPTFFLFAAICLIPRACIFTEYAIILICS